MGVNEGIDEFLVTYPTFQSSSEIIAHLTKFKPTSVIIKLFELNYASARPYFRRYNRSYDCRPLLGKMIEYPVEQGNIELVRYILDNWIMHNPNLAPEITDSLKLAAHNHHAEMYKLLLSYVIIAKIYEKGTIHQNNICETAGTLGDKDFITYVVEDLKISVHAADNAILINAADGGHVETVKWLLDTYRFGESTKTRAMNNLLIGK